MTNQKVTYLHQWANKLQQEVNAGKFGKARQKLAISFVNGPRVGGLDLVAQDNPGALKKALNENDGLNLANTVPWHFAEGRPNIFSHGRVIRVEAPWPQELAETNIPLRKTQAVVQKKFVSGWVAGNDDQGRLIVPNFMLESHWLFAGQTGSGKSVAMTSAIGQLAQASGGKTQFILIDGKHGESLSALAKAPYLVGPPAYDMETVGGALTWTISEMARRYTVLRNLSADQRESWEKETSRIVLVIDEIQTVSQRPEFAQMIALLLQQGRASKINLIVSTQYPLNGILGDSTMKQNLGGRVVLKMNSYEASRVAIGASEPDSTKLLGRGDAYIVAGGNFARVQIAYLNRHELAQLPTTAPDLDEWPAEDKTSADSLALGFSPKQVAVSILAAKDGKGRPALKYDLETSSAGRLGTMKLIDLLSFGREIWSILHDKL